MGPSSPNKSVQLFSRESKCRAGGEPPSDRRTLCHAFAVKKAQLPFTRAITTPPFSLWGCSICANRGPLGIRQRQARGQLAAVLGTELVVGCRRLPAQVLNSGSMVGLSYLRPEQLGEAAAPAPAAAGRELPAACRAAVLGSVPGSFGQTGQ